MGTHRTYREQRYDFARQLLTLRTRAALTQVEFAAQMGVHRRSVQNWEMGESYPKPDALQRIIALFLQHNAFTRGSERVEAQRLWQQAAQDGSHPLPPFDEAWFARTLAATITQIPSSLASPAPSSTPAIAAKPQVIPSAPPSRALIDWGEAIAAPSLHGREREMATLHRWVIHDRCRVISILGLGGMGKSSLAIAFAHSVLASFDLVLFHSLQNGPPLEHLLDQTLHAVSEQQAKPPEALSAKISLLIQLFRQRRCLLILDNLETILEPGALTGTYRAGYAEYGTLLRWLGEGEHQSCVLLTSREKPSELGPLEGRATPVRSLPLSALDADACRVILEAKDIFASPSDVLTLSQLYGGNPLALNLISEPIRELFGGDVGTFLATGDLFFNGVSKMLEQQFARSTPIEQSILYWLAIEREPVPVVSLLTTLGDAIPRGELFAALESLRRRTLIERSPDRPAFALQPVILEYTTEQLVATVAQEVSKGQPNLLQSHALMQAHTADYLRHSQEQLILSPLLRQLLLVDDNATSLAQRLLAQLVTWRNESPARQGYGPGNVVNLLRLLRGNLRGLDLSRLSLREVYWQGIEAQASNLSHTTIQDNVFTETFGGVHAVAASPLASYWAASSINGRVQVWRDGGRTAHLSIPAHTQQIKALAFSPDEQILATSSWDCTVKLWDMQSGALLSTLHGHTDFVQDICFAPAGNQLISGGDDRTLRLWDVATGQLLTTIEAHSDNLYGVAWSPDGLQVASCGFDHKVCVWNVASGECVLTLIGHTRPVTKIAFSPDGQMLASGGFDRTLRVWNLTSGECIKRFAEHSSTLMKVIWSADAATLATCSYDGTIRVWELPRDTARGVLLGHTASVNSIAFAADGKMLLSGSDDQTVRLWDVASGLCVRVIEGYGLFLLSVVWSPDGQSLLSANSDTTMTLWNVAAGTARQTLPGHTHTIYGVAWSPDGRWLVSSGFDQTVRIWDAQLGLSMRVIPIPTDALSRPMQWSPDGRWLASAGRDLAVRSWEVPTMTARWLGRGHASAINEVVWSPNGQQLASCSEDHTVRLWRAEDGKLLQTLVGHESSVAGVAWSPDGQYLASCGGGGRLGELFLWNATSGERERSLVGHTSVVGRVAWSQDSQRLFSGDMSGLIRCWDVEKGVNVQSWQAHQGWVRALAVSPDGLTLVSSGEDGVLHLWELANANHEPLSAEPTRTLRIDRPYERMNIRGLSGITEAQRAALFALGAMESEAS